MTGPVAAVTGPIAAVADVVLYRLRDGVDVPATVMLLDENEPARLLLRVPDPARNRRVYLWAHQGEHAGGWRFPEWRL